MRLLLLLAAILPLAASNVDDLQKAVRAGDTEQVRQLIQQGTPVNNVDSLGGTPLHDAVWAGEKEIVELLLTAHADVNARHAEAGSTPLHCGLLPK